MSEHAGMFDPLPAGRVYGHADWRPPASPKSSWRPILPVPADAPRTIPAHSCGQPSAVWDYRDATGALLGRVCRWDLGDGKKIMPLSYCENSAGRQMWYWQSLPAPRPLYGLDRIAMRPDAPVLVVEGEKTADAAGRLFPDYVVVTSSGGANAADTADWSPMVGRQVTIWRDNDERGRKYESDVARLAHTAGAATVRQVPVPTGWPEGFDLADPLPAGVTVEQLRAMIESAADAGPALSALGIGSIVKENAIVAECRCLADVAAVPIKWLWPGRFALGKTNIIAGHPGLGKSQLTALIAAKVSRGGKWP